MQMKKPLLLISFSFSPVVVMIVMITLIRGGRVLYKETDVLSRLDAAA